MSVWHWVMSITTSWWDNLSDDWFIHCMQILKHFKVTRTENRSSERGLEKFDIMLLHQVLLDKAFQSRFESFPLFHSFCIFFLVNIIAKNISLFLYWVLLDVSRRIFEIFYQFKHLGQNIICDDRVKYWLKVINAKYKMILKISVW